MIVVAIQSQSNIVKDVEDVGTILFGSDSLTFGIIILISLAFKRILFGSEAIPIILILFRFANLSILKSSEVFPEFEITINISLFPHGDKCRDRKITLNHFYLYQFYIKIIYI